MTDAEAALGPVDVLVNCAGIVWDVRSVAGMPWERAEALLKIDLLAPLRLQHAAPRAVCAAKAWIVNVSSMAGRVPLKGCAYYGAAKAGRPWPARSRAPSSRRAA